MVDCFLMLPDPLGLARKGIRCPFPPGQGRDDYPAGDQRRRKDMDPRETLPREGVVTT